MASRKQLAFLSSVVSDEEVIEWKRKELLDNIATHTS